MEKWIITWETESHPKKGTSRIAVREQKSKVIQWVWAYFKNIAELDFQSSMLFDSNSFSVKHWTCQITIEEKKYISNWKISVLQSVRGAASSVLKHSLPLSYSQEQAFALPNYCRVTWGWTGRRSFNFFIWLFFLSSNTLCWLRNSHSLWFLAVYFTFLSVYLALLSLPLHLTLSVQNTPSTVTMKQLNSWLQETNPAKLPDIIFLQNISLPSQTVWKPISLWSTLVMVAFFDTFYSAL